MDGDYAKSGYAKSDHAALAGGIEARLNYLLPSAEKPFAYQYDPPPGKPQRSGQYAEQAVTVGNGRRLLGPLSLDAQGFTLRRHASAVADFYDDAEVKRVYYPEVERLVAEATGAGRVIVFDHNQRNAATGRAAAPGIKQPVPRVHNDYTEKSGPQRLADLLGEAEAARAAAGRYAFVNLWRPIAGPVEDWHLAVCDARSIAAEDLVATDLIYPDRVGETYAATHSQDHRWYYFPLMRRDEALFIKCFDSDAARARFTAHTAFRDPTAPADAAPRESIEVRTIAVF